MCGNYSAFYVAEPFSTSNLGAFASKDFCYYNMLKMWKSADASFPFIDSHEKTYNVRDNSLWVTLQSRLRERLRVSKNVVLFLSSNTKHSRALNEEIDYGIRCLNLPVIVIYPEFNDYNEIINGNSFSNAIRSIWDRVPRFRDYLNKQIVPIAHIPLKKDLIRKALSDKGFMLSTKKQPGNYIV